MEKNISSSNDMVIWIWLIRESKATRSWINSNNSLDKLREGVL